MFCEPFRVLQGPFSKRGGFFGFRFNLMKSRSHISKCNWINHVQNICRIFFQAITVRDTFSKFYIFSRHSQTQSTYTCKRDRRASLILILIISVADPGRYSTDPDPTVIKKRIRIHILVKYCTYIMENEASFFSFSFNW